MKILKYLFVSAIFVALLSACSDEDKLEPEPDPEPEPEVVGSTEYPAPTVILEECGETSILLSWNEIENAVSYTAQLLDVDEVLAYREATEGTSVSFENLGSGTCWYARVRSEFEDDIHSDWAYVTYSDSDEHAVIVTGCGIVKFDVNIELVKATSSTLTYSWSMTGDNSVDVEDGYEVRLYFDNNFSATSLVVGWTIEPGSGMFDPDAGCRFTFSGLDESTNYFCQVTSTTYQGVTTSLLGGTTSALLSNEVVQVDGSAQVGDILVSEEFYNLYSGADPAFFAAGYSVNSSLRSSNYRPFVMDAENCVVVPFNTDEFNVFNGEGVTADYVNAIGLSDWGYSEGDVVGCAGYLRLGSANSGADLWTPVLSALPAEQESSVSVVFSAKNYFDSFGSSGDQGKLVLSGVQGATMADGNVVSGGETLYEFGADISNTSDDFQTFTVYLTGLNPDSRVRIAATDGRALIDDVVVTYLGVTNTEPLTVPENVVIDEELVGGTSVTVGWDEVENASYYRIRYWKDGDEANVKEIDNIFDTSCIISGLESLTTYWAQVMACDYNPELSSDYSDPVSGTTLEHTGVQVELVNAGTSTITVKWNVDGCTDQVATTYNYEIGLYTSSDCVDETLFVSWILDDSTIWTVENKSRVRFTFTGLSENTTYYVMVSVINDNGVVYDETLVSEPLRVSTIPFGYSVTAKEAGSATVGDVLVAEDFRGLVIGGDVVFKSAAVSNTKSKYRADWRVPKGKNPVDELNIKPCNWDTEYNIYYATGVTYDAIVAQGLEEWCSGYHTSCCSRSGYIKLGGARAYGYLATPELTAIPEGKTAKVRVDFEMAPHYITVLSSYCNNVIWGVVNDVKLVDDVDVWCQAEGWTTTADDVVFEDSVMVDVIQHNNDFGDVPFDSYSIELDNVTNKSRLRISSDTTIPADPNNKTRFELNSVVVTILELN